MIATALALLADLAQVTDPDYLDDAGTSSARPTPAPTPPTPATGAERCSSPCSSPSSVASASSPGGSAPRYAKLA